MFRLLFRVAVMAAMTSIALPLDAATYTWTGATDSLWTTTTNWSPTATAGGPVAADLLVFTGSTNATVNLSGSSQTVANIAYTGMTLPLTVTATNGSLTINGGNQSFGTQANGSLVTDYSGLSAFTYTQTGNNTFDVRMTIPAAGPTSGTATLRLATQGSGTNFVRAGTIQVGAAAGTSNGTAWGGVLGLGKANTFNATNFNLGGFNGSGSVAFQSGITNGTIVLRGTGGAATRVTTMDVGFTSSGTRDGSGTFDLTGGTLDALVTTLTVSRHGANGNNGPTSSFTMPGGALDTTTLVLGEKSNTTGTPTINSTFSQLGGSVVTGTMRFGNITASGSATTPIFTSIYNLSSGTLRAGLITSEPSVTITATTTSGSTSVRRIAWSGGTISNYDASTDLTISGTSTNAGYTMQLVLGSTTTPQVFNADTGRTITIGSNAVISGTGLVQKQGDGTLRINTGATYSGVTSINGGTVRLGVTNGLPAATALSLAPSSGTATLDLNGFNQTVASFASSGAGSSLIDVAATGTSTLTVGGDGSSTTFAGILRNSGSSAVLNLTKNGVGTLTLTGPNSTTAGALVVNTGKVTMDPGAGGGFAATGRLQLAPSAGNTATLEVLSGTNVFGTATGISGLGDNAATGTSTWQISGGSSTMQVTSNRFLIGNKGPATLRVSAGSLTFTGTQDIVIGGDIQYALNNATGAVTLAGGTLSISGSGNLYLGRNQSTGGTTTGANGTINLDGGVFASARPLSTFTGTNPATGTVNFNGGTLRALASSTNFIAVTTVNVQNGGAVIDTNAFDLAITQALQNAGSGGLTKLGAGVLTLSGSNGYIGSTAVNAGTLKAGNVNAFGAGAVTVASGATLDLSSLGVANSITNNGGTVSNATNYAGSQTLSGSSTFGNVGGTLVVANSGNATFGGALAAATTIDAGGNATLNNAGSITAAGLTNNGTFTIDRTGSSSLNTSFSGTGALVKAGAGAVTLTGSSGFSGGTQINAGTLKAGNANAVGSGGIAIANGATLDLSALAVGNTITNNGGTVSNAGSYAGSQTLNGASTFGDLGGTLVVANGGAAIFGGALAAATTINAGGNGTLNNAGSISAAGLTNNGTFTIDRTGSSSLATVFSGNGTLVKAGVGVVTLSGSSSFSGATQVNAGDLRVDGSLAGGVSVASTGILGGSGIVGAISGAGLVGPGNSPGILTSNGSLDPTGGIDFSFELTGTAPTWSAATASVNDVLHLTATTPTTALGSGNTINVYLNAGSLTAGNTFLGGIFIDQPQGALDLAPLVSGATFAYFVAGGSDVTYNGVGYSTLANYIAANPGVTGITASTVTVASADFATGTVTNGQVMQMVVVPEPGALAIVATGALAAGWAAARRIRRRG